MSYMVYQKERGESGTEHYQIYVEFHNKLALSTVKKFFHSSVHVEERRGTAKQASDYCKKPDSRIEEGKEFGELSRQGDRVDLKALTDKILAKETTVDNIMVETPMTYHQYGRTLEKVEDIMQRKRKRTEMTEGIWYYGETGVGKSHVMFEDYDEGTHYLWKPTDKGWWDGYKGQETVLINDFRGEMPYNELLQLVDKWPYKVSRRGREPMSFISKKVIITSSLHPADIYKQQVLKKDKLGQLLRRFDVIELRGPVMGPHKPHEGLDLPEMVTE